MSADAVDERYDGPVASTNQLLVVQPTPFCNIRCDYCYLPDRDSTSRLDRRIFRALLSKLFDSGLVGERLSIVWHAGEPLVLPVSYYAALLSVIDELSIPRARVRHSIQTNAMLLSESWCDFIAEHGINIGVSLDGPAFLHDAHRKDRQGRGTHERVLSGVRLLQDKGIDFHVIAVITQQSLAHADAIVDFFLDLGVRRLGFNIEELEGIHQTSSLRGRGLEDGVRAFWARLYARQQESGDRLTIREFARAHHNIVHGPGWVSEEQSLRLNSQVAPLAIISVDWRGNLSSFSPELLGVKTPAYGDFTFGNVLDEGDLWSMIRRPLFRRAAAEIARGVARCRAECQYFELCGGGAPSNKYFENGSFESTETMQCRTTVQMPIDVVLGGLERSTALRRGHQSFAVAAEGRSRS